MKFKALKIFLLTLGLLAIFLSVIPATLAETKIPFTPNVPLPTITITEVSGSTLGTFISKLAMLMTQLLVGFTIFMIILYGFQWILYANNSSKITAAKTNIIKALIGLTIGVFAVTILKTVSPGTTTFQSLGVDALEDWICCDMTAVTPAKSSLYLQTDAECKTAGGRTETNQAKKLEICGAQMPDGSGAPPLTNCPTDPTVCTAGEFCDNTGNCQTQYPEGEWCLGMTWVADEYKQASLTGLYDPVIMAQKSQTACQSGTCQGDSSGMGTSSYWNYFNAAGAGVFSLFGLVQPYGFCGSASPGSGTGALNDTCTDTSSCGSGLYCAGAKGTSGKCTAELKYGSPCGDIDAPTVDGTDNFACENGKMNWAKCEGVDGDIPSSGVTKSSTDDYCVATKPYVARGGFGCEKNADCATPNVCVCGSALLSAKGGANSGPVCAFGFCQKQGDPGDWCNGWSVAGESDDDLCANGCSEGIAGVGATHKCK